MELLLSSELEDFGTMRRMGTVDFYPAGGRYMPGCSYEWCEYRIAA